MAGSVTSQISWAEPPKGAQQVDLALIGVGEGAAVAHADHLRAAPDSGVGSLLRLAGYVGEIAGMSGVGDVHHEGGAVTFLHAGEGIGLRTAVMADVGDPALPLMMNRRLIGI